MEFVCNHFFFYAIILLLFSMIVDTKDLEFRVKILKERKGMEGLNLSAISSFFRLVRRISCKNFEEKERNGRFEFVCNLLLFSIGTKNLEFRVKILKKRKGMKESNLSAIIFFYAIILLFFFDDR